MEGKFEGVSGHWNCCLAELSIFGVLFLQYPDNIRVEHQVKDPYQAHSSGLLGKVLFEIKHLWGKSCCLLLVSPNSPGMLLCNDRMHETETASGSC